MTPLDWLLLAASLIALSTLAMTLLNLRRYRSAPRTPPTPPAQTPAPAHPDPPLISVCIPARNEERNIEHCVRSLLANHDPAFEVLVYDDQSTDATPDIIARLADADPRVRSAPTAPLPAGWNGKQFACSRLAAAARGRWLLFTDADVRFSTDALRRTLNSALHSRVQLVSTVPHQQTGSLVESLVVPLIYFLLMSYLPIGRMRSTTDPNASAGCGQFLFVSRAAYDASGGHAAFKDSMHDGIKMPRAVRAAGLATDIFNGDDLASCRMYHGAAQTWRGFAKNAYEGLGSPALLVFLTLLHLVGHVLPWLYLPWALAAGFPHTYAAPLAAAAVVCNLIQRTALCARFRNPPISALLHPLGILLMTAIQWHSFFLALTGRRSWRGRTMGPHHLADAVH